MLLNLDKLEKSVGELEVVVDGNTTKIDVKKVCSIDTQDLVEEFTKQAGYYAWYATILSLYEARKNELENKIEVKYAELDLAIRASYSHDDLKNVKERSIDSKIIVDDGYMTLKEEFLAVSKIVKRLIALVKALEMKSNMLVQTGARARKEMELDSPGR